jgi:hypothetical protein
MVATLLLYYACWPCQIWVISLHVTKTLILKWGHLGESGEAPANDKLNVCVLNHFVWWLVQDQVLQQLPLPQCSEGLHRPDRGPNGHRAGWDVDQWVSSLPRPSYGCSSPSTSLGVKRDLHRD